MCVCVGGGVRGDMTLCPGASKLLIRACWRHIRLKPVRESKTSSRVRSAPSRLNPSCRENMTETLCKVTQHFILFHKVFFSANFVEHLIIIFMCRFRGLVLYSFMVQGTLNIHCECVCSWNKFRKMWCIVCINMTHHMQSLLRAYETIFHCLVFNKQTKSQ